MTSTLDEKIYRELRSEFISESQDNLEDMEGSLNDFFDRVISGPDALTTILQKAHTIKGLASPFGFSLLTTVTHQFEDFMMGSTAIHTADVATIQLFIDTMKECLLHAAEPDREMQNKILERLPKTRQSAPPNDDKPLQILIITSSRTVYMKIAAELKMIGFHIDHASNSLLGIELTTTSQPDIVIVSDILDRMSGIDLVCAFVAMPITEKIPVIYMTSFERDHSELNKLPAHVPTISLGSNIEEEILGALTGIENRFIQSEKACI